jgi:preprotein translocase subunit SecE
LARKSQVQAANPGKRRFAFFRDTYNELKKVTWPSRRDGIRLTIMVIAVCAVVGLFLGALDYGFAELVTKVLLGGS